MKPGMEAYYFHTSFFVSVLEYFFQLCIFESIAEGKQQLYPCFLAIQTI